MYIQKYNEIYFYDEYILKIKRLEDNHKPCDNRFRDQIQVQAKCSGKSTDEYVHKA